MSRVTQDYADIIIVYAYRTVTFCGPTFQTVPLDFTISFCGPTTPLLPCDSNGLGSSPVARHYWGNH